MITIHLAAPRLIMDLHKSFSFSFSFFMSVYFSSDLTTLEEFKRITKIKIIFRGMRGPSASEESGPISDG